MGLPMVKNERLNEMLKTAVKNSERKLYHGGVEVAFPLPNCNERICEMIKEAKLFDYDTMEEVKNEEEVNR